MLTSPFPSFLALFIQHSYILWSIDRCSSSFTPFFYVSNSLPPLHGGCQRSVHTHAHTHSPPHFYFLTSLWEHKAIHSHSFLRHGTERLPKVETRWGSDGVTPLFAIDKHRFTQPVILALPCKNTSMNVNLRAEHSRTSTGFLKCWRRPTCEDTLEERRCKTI